MSIQESRQQRIENWGIFEAEALQRERANISTAKWQIQRHKAVDNLGLDAWEKRIFTLLTARSKLVETIEIEEEAIARKDLLLQSFWGMIRYQIANPEKYLPLDKRAKTMLDEEISQALSGFLPGEDPKTVRVDNPLIRVLGQAAQSFAAITTTTTPRIPRQQREKELQFFFETRGRQIKEARQQLAQVH